MIKEVLLQGCGFDREKFIDPRDNMAEFIKLDTIYLAWISEEEGDLHEEALSGDFPLFITANREKILCKLNIPNDKGMSKRVIAGAALLLTDED